MGSRRGERDQNLFGGDGDLAGLLLRLLADEPHHLLDLLGHISFVHLRIAAGIRRLSMDRAPEPRTFPWSRREEGGCV